MHYPQSSQVQAPGPPGADAERPLKATAAGPGDCHISMNFAAFKSLQEKIGHFIKKIFNFAPIIDIHDCKF